MPALAIVEDFEVLEDGVGNLAFPGRMLGDVRDHETQGALPNKT
jgi:hypothetical protein